MYRFDFHRNPSANGKPMAAPKIAKILAVVPSTGLDHASHID
jgi:hypothetical protein